MRLILHPLHFVIKQWLHVKLSYLLLERKLFLIYWMVNILQSLRSLIQSQIHHPVIKFQCRTRKCVDHHYQWKISPHSSTHAWKFQRHQTKRGKYKVNIILCRSKRYQRKDLEDIWFIFDQFRPVVSHLEVSLSEKPLTPKYIGEDLKGPQRKFWKEDLFLQYEKSKNAILLLSPIPIKFLPDWTKVLW